MSAPNIAAALEQISVFFGQADAAQARVYAQLSTADLPSGCQLIGTVRGPMSRYARTLASDVPLRPPRTRDAVPSSGWLLSEAVVPDPCFWSPELPYVYDVRVELRQGDRALGAVHRLLGIRTLGAHGGRLMWDGCNWVLRGVDASVVEPAADLAQWRDSGAAMLADCPDNSLCEETSRVGVLMIARLRGGAAMIASELHRVAQWPSVGLALLEPAAPLSEDVRSFARNVLLVERCRAVIGDAAAWAHVRLSPEEHLSGSDAPLMAERRILSALPLVAARGACDALQRDLAASQELDPATRSRIAGYVVTA